MNHRAHRSVLSCAASVAVAVARAAAAVAPVVVVVVSAAAVAVVPAVCFAVVVAAVAAVASVASVAAVVVVIMPAIAVMAVIVVAAVAVVVVERAGSVLTLEAGAALGVLRARGADGEAVDAVIGGGGVLGGRADARTGQHDGEAEKEHSHGPAALHVACSAAAAGLPAVAPSSVISK